MTDDAPLTAAGGSRVGSVGVGIELVGSLVEVLGLVAVLISLEMLLLGGELLLTSASGPFVRFGRFALGFHLRDASEIAVRRGFMAVMFGPSTTAGDGQHDHDQHDDNGSNDDECSHGARVPLPRDPHTCGTADCSPRAIRTRVSS